jgi:zinc D-Ala-D-Ala carboxypeptidase
MRLSTNFDLSEFTTSETAARLGIRLDPPMSVVARLALWCELIGEPLRARFGRPVVITSGWRNTELNAAVDGAAGSLHMAGRAADVTVPGVSVRDVCHAVIDLKLPFDELICEYGQWTHIGVADIGKPAAGRVFTAMRDGSIVRYSKGVA